MFNALADQLESQLRTASITPDTLVALVFEFEDPSIPAQRVEMSHVKVTIAPAENPNAPKVFGPEQAKHLAAGIFIDTVVGNINSLVRHGPEGVQTVRLEIV
jgi:hypothetical protein